jgi:exopolysaccharide biosynthesis polyprenyl glycosylphosphotransferase
MEAGARVVAGQDSLGFAADEPPIAIGLAAIPPLEGEEIAHVQAVAEASDLALGHSGMGLAGIATDAMALVVAAVIAVGALSIIFAHGKLTAGSYPFTESLVRVLATVPFLTVMLATTRARWSLRSTMGQHLGAVTPAIAAGGLIAMTGWQLAHGAGLVRPPNPNVLIAWCATSLGTVTVARAAHHAPPRRQGRRARRVLIVGTGVVASRVAEQLAMSGGVEVVGFVDDDPIDPSGWVGKLNELSLVCDRDCVDHIIVAFSKSSSEHIIEALRPMHGRVPITVVPRLFDVLPATAALHDLGSGLTGISVAPATLGHGPKAIKRVIDVLGAGGALLVLSPLLALVALAIKMDSPGPVFFEQERVGLNGRRFRMTKFRSMRVETASHHPSVLDGVPVRGPFPKLKDDPRVTKVGRFIRKTSLDELPQLLNVLRGQMSLVGPRPFVPDDAAFIEGWAQRRYSVKPGITGLWQVSGRNDLTFEEMCRLDSLYVSCWSIGLDIRILLRTLRAVYGRSGAY